MSLYKYVTPERLDALRSLRIRFTQPGLANDPFELRPLVSRFRSPEVARQALSEPLAQEWDRQFEEKILKQFGPELVREFERQNPGYFASQKAAALPQADLQADQAARQEIHERLNNLGILSLSETPSNVLMWTHYAANHTGLVYELDNKHPWFWTQRPEGDDCGNLRKVRYCDRPSSPYLADLEAHEVFYTKERKWEYEREWRVILPLAESAVDLGAGIFLFDIPAEVITGVIAGLRTNSDSLTELERILRSSPHFEHIRTGRIVESERSNTLEIDWT